MNKPLKSSCHNMAPTISVLPCQKRSLVHFLFPITFLGKLKKKCHLYGHTVALCYIVVHTSFCLWQPVIWEVFVHTRWLPMYVQFLICLYFFALGVTVCIVRYWLRSDFRVAHLKWRVINELHVRESLLESFEIKFIYSRKAKLFEKYPNLLDGCSK